MSTESKPIRLHTLVSLGSLLGILLACGMVIYRQGTIVKTMDQLVADVTEMKIKGSIPLQRHEALDDERYKSAILQMVDMKAVVGAMNDNRSEISVMSERLRNIDKVLEEVRLATARHMQETK